jgi:Holliday junction resolvase-like predicted endonuclease
MQSLDFFILGAVLGLFVFYKISQYYKSKKQQIKITLAKRAESAAGRLLQKTGYRIIDTQKRVQVKTKIDGELFRNTIIADFLVKKNGKTFLVEVKTGKQTEKITSPSIRRQLLEYFLVFRPDGLILLDMTEKKLHQVEFELENRFGPPWALFLRYTIFFLLGALTTWAYVYF